MDIQLQELIDKIKKEGISKAEEDAKATITAAEKKAEQIIADANAKAEEILKNAKAEIQRVEKASEEAIVQAARNMLLSFKDGIIGELDGLIQTQTENVLSKDLLVKLIPELIKNWAKNTDASELSVLLSEKDLKDLENSFTSELKAEISKGMEIKVDKTLSSGFRIGVKNGAAFYDYSAESLAQMFSAYLNPKVAGLIQIAAKDAN